MKRFNILVFPAGSEIGLEVYRSLRYSNHLNIIGANSVDDHGRFVFEKYIDGLPMIDSDQIIPSLKKVITDHQIDAIYPTMDKVIWKLKSHEHELGCKIVCSSQETTEICLAKSRTYAALDGKVKVPKIFSGTDEIKDFPVFLKPDIGYGSRGTYKVETAEELQRIAGKVDLSEYLILEYLPGEEFTVDCFTNRHGQLLFAGPRRRKRIVNGISVNTEPVRGGQEKYLEIANIINGAIKFRGAWFFQVKRDSQGELTLMEIASRLGGSSAIYRMMGVNFALMSVFDLFDIDVEALVNEYEIESDRALDSKFKTSLHYSTIYVDFDDCIIIKNEINHQLVAFLYKSLNEQKKIVLLSRSTDDLKNNLKKYRLENLFDEILHIPNHEEKHKYIKDTDAIFIDDSFAERRRIAEHNKIPVFSPDMIELFN